MLKVDFGKFPFNHENFFWTSKVDALHEVDDRSLQPLANGMDWIYQGHPDQQINLTANAAEGTVSFRDQGFGFATGTGVLLRHVLEFSRPELDSIVVAGCAEVLVHAVTVHTSPGMAVLIFNSTNVLLEEVVNIPAGGMPLAGNADAMHVASCRGTVAVKNCVANGQGDDGLNIHSQYAEVMWTWMDNVTRHTRMAVGPVKPTTRHFIHLKTLVECPPQKQ